MEQTTAMTVVWYTVLMMTVCYDGCVRGTDTRRLVPGLQLYGAPPCATLVVESGAALSPPPVEGLMPPFGGVVDDSGRHRTGNGWSSKSTFDTAGSLGAQQ